MISDPFTKEWVGILPPQNCAQVNTHCVAPPGGREMGEMGILFSMMPKNKVGDHGERRLAAGAGQCLQEWGQMESRTIHHPADFLGPTRRWYEEHSPCHDPPRGAADRNIESALTQHLSPPRLVLLTLAAPF